MRVPIVVRSLKKYWLLLLILVIGSTIQLLQVSSSGLRYADGVSFFRVNADDGMLHLSFIGSMVREFPPQQPGAVGLAITNYHYWADLYLAELVRVWRVPISHAFFQYLPLILSVGTGAAVISLMRRWSQTAGVAVFGLLWLYFATDLTYIFALVLQNQWGFAMSAIDNGATQLLNIPHSVAKLIFVVGLIPLSEFARKGQTRWAWLALALHAPLVGFKVYFGLFAAIVWAGVGLVRLWESSRSSPRQFQTSVKQLAVLAGVFFLTSAVIYLPGNSNAGGLFWSPLEWPRIFLGADNLDWQLWWLRKQVYEASGSWRGIIAMDMISIAICLACVYGTRMVGWWPWLGRTTVPVGVRGGLYAGSVIFTLLGLYTLQVSGLFNVFNFLAVAATALALFAALVSASWWQRGWLGKVLVLALLLLNAPRIFFHASEPIRELWRYQARVTISPAEEELLTTIRLHTTPDTIIQTHPQNTYDQNPPYSTFFTNRQSYLTGTGMLRSHNQPIAERRANLPKLFSATDSAIWLNRIRDEDIDIVIFRRVPQELPVFPATDIPGTDVLIENEAGVVVKIN